MLIAQPQLDGMSVNRRHHADVFHGSCVDFRDFLRLRTQIGQ